MSDTTPRLEILSNWTAPPWDNMTEILNQALGHAPTYYFPTVPRNVGGDISHVPLKDNVPCELAKQVSVAWAHWCAHRNVTMIALRKIERY